MNDGLPAVALNAPTAPSRPVRLRAALWRTPSFAPNAARSERRMVEAAGVEPASLTNKPAATTCLVRREFQTLDNVLTRIHYSNRHVIFSGPRAPIPRVPYA